MDYKDEIDYAARTPAAPVPASAEQTIYQVQFITEAGSSAWRDASEDAYHTFMPERCRIVYATPVSARELDVEAERREFEAAYIAYLQECYGQRAIPEDDLAGHFERSGHYPDKYVRCQAEWRGWLWRAARSVDQGPQAEST